MRTLTTTKKTRVTLKPEALYDAIRKLAGAPDDAEIIFNAGYDFLRTIEVEWTETETEEQEA